MALNCRWHSILIYRFTLSRKLVIISHRLMRIVIDALVKHILFLDSKISVIRSNFFTACPVVVQQDIMQLIPSLKSKFYSHRNSTLCKAPVPFRLLVTPVLTIPPIWLSRFLLIFSSLILRDLFLRKVSNLIRTPGPMIFTRLKLTLNPFFAGCASRRIFTIKPPSLTKTYLRQLTLKNPPCLPKKVPPGP